MTTGPILPDLPGAAAWRVDGGYWTHRDSIPAALLPPATWPEPLFSAAQVNAIRQSAVNAALEWAAKLAHNSEPDVGPRIATAIRAAIKEQAVQPASDNELPGMWERADFEGGLDEIRGPDWKPLGQVPPTPFKLDTPADSQLRAPAAASIGRNGGDGEVGNG